MKNKINQNSFFNYLDENDLRSPKTGERPKASDDNFLLDAIALIPIPIVIIVDGLDKVNQYKFNLFKKNLFFFRVIFINNENIVKHFHFHLFIN